jgi:NADPH2:quinone reductase
MKAVLCRRYGPPETLEWGDIEEPEITSGGVRIAIKAAALNFPDLLAIEGKYQWKVDFPFSPGFECAGMVLETGPEVEGIEVGQRVAAHPWRDCLAEQVVAPAELVFPIPERMDFPTAAGFTIVYGTVHHALIDRGRLQPGETLVVLGAAGGVGLAAVELGKQLGATVIAAAGGDEKLALCREYGADHGIDYRDGRLREAVKDLTGGNGADVIFDPVGGDMTDQAVRCVNWRGRILIIGFASGRIAQTPANYTLLRGAEIVGVAYHGFFNREPDLGRRNMADLMARFGRGELRPHHSITLPMNQAVEAMTAIAERRSTGKVILLND